MKVITLLLAEGISVDVFTAPVVPVHTVLSECFPRGEHARRIS
jgi:hypothetical protein